MIHVLIASSTPVVETSTSTAQAVAFWILAPLAVVAAILVVVSRKSVHSAIWMALTMIILAIFFLMEGAYFLGIVQVVVYTGAVMMLFLFVLMLVGVDASDSLVETLRGQRWVALLLGLGLGGLLVGAIGQVTFHGALGTTSTEVLAGGHVEAIAQAIFTRYVYAFEVTSALLITAAVGAMVLAHRERLTARPTQRDLSIQRFRDGTHPTPYPSPGVFARHNAVGTPALLPDGTPSDASIPAALRSRGTVGSVGAAELEPTDEATGEVEP
jgi:NADH-quinone oxidoreductase subunit J